MMMAAGVSPQLNQAHAVAGVSQGLPPYGGQQFYNLQQAQNQVLGHNVPVQPSTSLVYSTPIAAATGTANPPPVPTALNPGAAVVAQNSQLGRLQNSPGVQPHTQISQSNNNYQGMASTSSAYSLGSSAIAHS